MPGIGEEMDAAMQQAAQPFRQSIDTSPSSFVCFLYGNIVGEKRKECSLAQTATKGGIAGCLSDIRH
jgi:hypothetical protein